MPSHPPIGFMVWRIGTVLDVGEQIAWVRDHGFGAVSLHGSSGTPGAWQGVEPAAADKRTRAALRDRVNAFQGREMHAPFSAVMTARGADKALTELAPVLKLAADIGAEVVTVHAEVPAAESADLTAWIGAITDLDALAADNDLRIGLEITAGFELVRDLALPHVGVTLDVGHMYLGAAPPITAFKQLGDVVRLLGNTLVHLHLHQVRGGIDHVGLNTGGAVDYDSLITALRETAYSGMVCLELNPDRVTPDGIVESRVWFEHRWQESEQ